MWKKMQKSKLKSYYSEDFVHRTEWLIQKLQDLIVEAKKVGVVLKTKGKEDVIAGDFLRDDEAVIAGVEDFLRDDEEKVSCDYVSDEWLEVSGILDGDMHSNAEEVLKMLKVKAETVTQ